MLRSIRRLVLILPLFACASVGAPELPECESIERLAALPDASCMGDPATAEFRSRLRESLSSDVGPLLVRVMLDDSSRVRSLCTGSTLVPGGWRARTNLSTRYAEISEIDGGPACLANRRLDFNRKAAKLAENKRRRLGCTRDLATITRTGAGLSGPESATMAGESQTCVDHGADWIVLNPGGLKHPSVFAKPEVADPPAISASKTREKCFKLRGFDARVTCIKDEGWELLE